MQSSRYIGLAGHTGEATDLDLLRQQVLDIISSVLEDGGPEYAGAKSRLRQCLAHHIGFPEKALLEHLLALHGSDLYGDPEEPQV
jgi:hypothetical protein